MVLQTIWFFLWGLLWDICIFVGSIAPAVLFSVAFVNIYQGIPVDAEGVYHGTLFTLLNPYGLLGGLVCFSSYHCRYDIFRYCRTFSQYVSFKH